jgi:hypothetical protein
MVGAVLHIDEKGCRLGPLSIQKITVINWYLARAPMSLEWVLDELEKYDETRRMDSKRPHFVG